MKFTSICLVFASLLLFVPSIAQADHPAGHVGAVFGEKGQFVPAGSLYLGMGSTKAPGGGSTSEFRFSFEPQLSYFVIDNVLVGAGLLGAVRSPEGGADTSTFGISVNGGYNFNLMSQLSILPELILGYGSSSMTISGNKFSSSAFSMEIFVPVLWHIVPHFFIGAGPDFRTDLTATDKAGDTSSDGSKVTTFGLATTIGGWF